MSGSAKPTVFLLRKCVLLAVRQPQFCVKHYTAIQFGATGFRTIMFLAQCAQRRSYVANANHFHNPF